MRFTVNPPLHCNAPRKVEGQMGSDFYLRFGKAAEIKTFFTALMRFVESKAGAAKLLWGIRLLVFPSCCFLMQGGNHCKSNVIIPP